MKHPRTPRDAGLPMASVPSLGLVPAASGPPALVQEALKQLGSVPDIIRRAGALEVYVSFFLSKYENANTRRAYKRAVDGFLLWCDGHDLELAEVAPTFVGMYRDEMSGSVAKKRQVLAALRKFFDVLVERHYVQLNPARSTENPKERLDAEGGGKTLMLPLSDAEKLLGAIDRSSVVGQRDFAAISVMVSTGCRVGAVSKLRRKDIYYANAQWYVRLTEKNSKIRDIPVRHDMQGPFLDYLQAADVLDAPDSHHVFRSAQVRTGTFRPYVPEQEKPKKVPAKGFFTSDDMGRMMTRRLCDVDIGEKKTVTTMLTGKPKTRTVYRSPYSPHSLRVAVITDLLDQGEDIHDVAFLVGHSSTRTTQGYNRNKMEVKRNLVERIRVHLPTTEKFDAND